jgi:hypothetical protein
MVSKDLRILLDYREPKTTRGQDINGPGLGER